MANVSPLANDVAYFFANVSQLIFDVAFWQKVFFGQWNVDRCLMERIFLISSNWECSTSRIISQKLGHTYHKPDT